MARIDAAPHPNAAPATTSPNHQPCAAPDEAAQLLEHAVADGCAAVTARAYLADWAAFTRWCATRGDNPLPATPATVTSYLTELAASRTNATVQRRHAAIAKVHELARLTSPTHSLAVRHAMRQLRAIPERQHVRHVAAVDTAVLRQLLATLDPTADEPPARTAHKHRQRARDRALLLIGFTAGLRRSELVGLDVADILHTPSGLEILVRQPASTPPQPPRRIQLGSGTDPATCPVRAWQAWQQAAGLTDGPAFRPVDRWGNLRTPRSDQSASAAVPLSDRAVAEIVKRCAAQANLDPSQFSGHSLRAGFVVEATRREMPLEQIIARAGVSTALSHRYLRRPDLWTHNPAARIGL
jgi:site-specific recombinase XerD